MASLGTEPEVNKLLLDALAKPEPPGSSAKALANRQPFDGDNGSGQSIGTARYYLWLGA